MALLGSTGLREMGWIPLGEQFDRLALAPSTRYAIAYFSPTAGQSLGIRNLNQVQASVDCSALRFLDRHYPDLFAIGIDQPHGADSDLLVDSDTLLLFVVTNVSYWQ